MLCVTPNLSIIYISECYTGHISDKALTKEPSFLDQLSSFSPIMPDKVFHLLEKCTERNINFIVHPGRRGISQMNPTELRKTSAIARVRILVEQVTRKTETLEF